MSSIEDRIQEIGQQYAHLIQDVLVLSLTDETFRLILALNDGSTLRVTERWQNRSLIRYSYYWLDTGNQLKTGWDNSPHHDHLDNFPHHKHVGKQAIMLPSYETSLDAVMDIITEDMTLQNQDANIEM